MSQPAIQVENLVVEYKGRSGKRVPAVNGLSFSVNPGEVVGFLGPNGAGKSSTLRTLMGFQRAAGGTATVLGHPAGSVQARERVGFLPEVALYYPFLNPREILRIYGSLQGLRGAALRSQVDELLQKVGLSERAGHLCRNLSKGQLQRVGIAQSLLGKPELLVLDEVTSGLDPVGRRELRALLQERRENGATIFFSSHELGEVEMLCDRILVINNGRLVEERRMNELRDTLTRHYLRFRPPLDLADIPYETTTQGDTMTAYFETKEQLLEALNWVQRLGGEVLDIGASEDSLEDFFVETIQKRAA